jgi:hypothetical protein
VWILRKVASRIDGLNPVIIRELRQAVRSNWLQTMSLCYLAVLFLLCIATIGFENVPYGDGEHLGREVFKLVLAVVAFTVMVIVPLYTFNLTSTELPIGDWDLMYFSLIPRKYIKLGKVNSALILAGVLISLCLPFLAVAVMLRGVDFFAILWGLLSAGLLLLLGTNFATFSASIQAHRWARIICVGVLIATTSLGVFGIFYFSMGVGWLLLFISLCATLAARELTLGVFSPKRRKSRRIIS